MKTIKQLILMTIAVFTASCNQKQAPKANDEYREMVLSKIKLQKDTLLIVNNFLDNLYSKNIAYGEFIKHEYHAIEDSCYKANETKIDVMHEKVDYEYVSNFEDSVKNGELLIIIEN